MSPEMVSFRKLIAIETFVEVDCNGKEVGMHEHYVSVRPLFHLECSEHRRSIRGRWPEYGPMPHGWAVSYEEAVTSDEHYTLWNRMLDQAEVNYEAWQISLATPPAQPTTKKRRTL